MLLKSLVYLSLNEIVSLSSGVQANNKRTECPDEQIALECPDLESVLQNGTFLEFQWRVTDPKHLKKQNIVYCNQSWQCTRYKNIKSFHQRIKVSNPVHGTLLVKQMKLNDRLVYTCVIERSGNRGPIANKIIVTSSKHCLSSTAGQNLDLGQTFQGMVSKETVEDIEWYRVSQDGTKVKIAYCSPSSPCRLVENCISSCPEYLTRLKTDGVSIILSNATKTDRGLEFRCLIHPKIMTKGPQVYMIKIKDISPRKAVDIEINRTTFKPRTTATSAANTTAPTGNNPGSYSIQKNSWLIALSVVISLVMAPYGIS